MQKKSITKNYIYNLAYQILVLILPLVTAPYISRVLGAENIGIYSYTTSISAYFILFGSLGIALYGQREIAYNQGDRKAYSKTFWEIASLRTITIIISLILFYFIFAKPGNNDYTVFYQILLIEIAGTCIDISWLFQGLEEFKKTVLRNTLVKIISIISIFMFVKEPEDLNLYFIIYVASVVIGNISLWISLPKYVDRVKIKELNIFKHLKPTIVLFIPQIAIQVYTIFDRTMIGSIILDKSEVGYYDQSQKIIKVLLTVVTSLGTVMLPRISNSFANGEKKVVLAYMRKSFRVVFLLALPMLFGIISVSNMFVPLFFGQGYDRVAVLMKVISPILLLIGMSNVIGTQYLLPTKRQREFTISVVSGAVVNFIMNMCLIWKFGAIGASIGTVIAELTVTSLQIYFVRKDFDLKAIFKSAKNYLIASLAMFAVCMTIGSFIKYGISPLLFQVGIGTFIYAVILILLKDELIGEVVKKIKNVIGI